MLRRDSAHVRTPAAPAAVDEPKRRTTRAAALAAAVAALAALVLGLAAAGGAGPAQAAPPAAMTATLADDGACAFKATVTWKKTLGVDRIYAAFYHDGTFVATMEAPGTGPNAGTIKGVKAVFQTGAFPAAAESHAWHVLVQPYTSEGVALPQVTTNVVNANCTIPPQ